MVSGGDPDHMGASAEAPEAPRSRRYRHVGVVVENTRKPRATQHKVALTHINDLREHSDSLGTRAIIGASMLYIVLGRSERVLKVMLLQRFRLPSQASDFISQRTCV